MQEFDSILIELDHIRKGLILSVDARKKNSLFESEEAIENGEARYQLVEGCFYDYCFECNESDNDVFFFRKDKVIQPHSRNRQAGTISPNIHVGTLSLPVFSNEKELGMVNLEVQSIKAKYRDDYRKMLGFITEKCSDLLLQAYSPSSHQFESDYSRSNENLYQRFAFVKSILSADEFSEAVHRIVSGPVTRWREMTEYTDIRKARRLSSINIREIASGRSRTKLSGTDFFRSYGFDSLPDRISVTKKADTVDTPENRFVKHALETFLKFCLDFNKAAKTESRLAEESSYLARNLESHLSHSVFKEISRPSTLVLNSPALQRKEGYREIFRVWLMFDLAAKLAWRGGDDIYSGGKKDVAVLYEYWLFFVLLDSFQSIFDIEPISISNLIKVSDDGLSLSLKQGRHTALSGVYDTGTRRLNIRFNYNRSFGGRSKYPDPGSWTVTMRPDYTLSFWPYGITESEAERQELIFHIHFDAKYKIADLSDVLKRISDENLDQERDENRRGIYKNADLLKMHAYKDAIRRTEGAYVLYPGDKPLKKKGFHEVIPGLGAFPISPSDTDAGIMEFNAFILELIDHFDNRASQRERLAYRVYDVYRNIQANDLRDALPEVYGDNRALIPDDTHILVASYKKENWEKIESSGLYFVKAEGSGEQRIGPNEAGAEYVLLYSENERVSGKLMRITEAGPRIFTEFRPDDSGYIAKPGKGLFLAYRIEEVRAPEFENQYWDIAKLSGFREDRASAYPFSVTLTELMSAKV